jgi:hypothetical protein
MSVVPKITRSGLWGILVGVLVFVLSLGLGLQVYTTYQARGTAQRTELLTQDLQAQTSSIKALVSDVKALLLDGKTASAQAAKQTLTNTQALQMSTAELQTAFAGFESQLGLLLVQKYGANIHVNCSVSKTLKVSCAESTVTKK